MRRVRRPRVNRSEREVVLPSVADAVAYWSPATLSAGAVASWVDALASHTFVQADAAKQLVRDANGLQFPNVNAVMKCAAPLDTTADWTVYLAFFPQAGDESIPLTFVGAGGDAVDLGMSFGVPGVGWFGTDVVVSAESYNAYLGTFPYDWPFEAPAWFCMGCSYVASTRRMRWAANGVEGRGDYVLELDLPATTELWLGNTSTTYTPPTGSRVGPVLLYQQAHETAEMASFTEFMLGLWP